MVWVEEDDKESARSRGRPNGGKDKSGWRIEVVERVKEEEERIGGEEKQKERRKNRE